MFATINDLWARWPAHPDIPEETAEAFLSDASDLITDLFEIPSSPDEALGRTLRRITVAMTRRALTRFGEDGLESVTDSQGPFSTSMKFSNPDGNLYVTKQEREAIENALAPSAGDFVVTQSSGW
ncbi:hypothetical protein SFC07_11050 [Corynebacterium callunae]|uniref:hypothetical protein n=1 Tax=Corynebacterium callunae TaxID=1721 RepID=UPI003982D49F